MVKLLKYLLTLGLFVISAYAIYYALLSNFIIALPLTIVGVLAFFSACNNVDKLLHIGDYADDKN